jgi:hypothetical protein
MRHTLIVLALVFAVAGIPTSEATPSATSGNSTAQRYLPRHPASFAGTALADVLSGRFRAGSSTINSGVACPAERGTAGNVQVNCQAEDHDSAQNTQSETTIVAVGRKVVVGFNDSLVCCQPAINFAGYSVSTDRGRSFTDMGDVPWTAEAQPLGDPSLASDAAGNVYYASLAFNGASLDSEISLYEMPVGSNRFDLLSIPVNVGNANNFNADKDLLSIARDGRGHRHFYLTWTYYALAHSSVEGPVMLSDSVDGVHWRTTQVSSSDTCAPSTPGSHPVAAGGTVYVTWEQFDMAACSGHPDVTSASQMIAAVDVATHNVTRIVSAARVRGAGDTITPCGLAGDLETIETQPGHDARLFNAPSSTIDKRGTIYMVWNDRPLGTGGGFANATRIYMSYSTDGAHSWSTPRVISGSVATDFMNDRFQPWIVADALGLHAMWYERVKNPSGGPDLIRTDKEDLSLATPTTAPTPWVERPLSTVPFPIYQTNPNQDPAIAACYMGDYNQITSDGGRRFVSWGDNRNIATPSGSTPEYQADVFEQGY